VESSVLKRNDIMENEEQGREAIKLNDVSTKYYYKTSTSNDSIYRAIVYIYIYIADCLQLILFSISERLLLVLTSPTEDSFVTTTTCILLHDSWMRARACQSHRSQIDYWQLFYFR